jgi:hypothetical protein
MELFNDINLKRRPGFKPITVVYRNYTFSFFAQRVILVSKAYMSTEIFDFSNLNVPMYWRYHPTFLPAKRFFKEG